MNDINDMNSGKTFSWRARRGAGFFALCLMYLASAATGAAQGSKGNPKRNMLWRVTSENNMVYILGSVHMLPKSAYPLDPAIEGAFDAASKVVFELNMDSVNNMSAAMGMMKRGTYEGDRTLEKSISKETYQLVKKRMGKSGLPPAMFNKFEPWMVAMMLSAFDVQNSGYENEHGIDFYFHGKAKEAGKEVIGLETLDFQVDLFDGMPEKAQEEFLKQTLEMSPGSAGKMLDKMVAAWKKGDAKELEKITAKHVSAESGVYDGILYERNMNWIPKIEEFLHDGEKHLVIVGALHLVGERGVIEMLRAKGYGVEQL